MPADEAEGEREREREREMRVKEKNCSSRETRHTDQFMVKHHHSLDGEGGGGGRGGGLVKGIWNRGLPPPPFPRPKWLRR